MEREELVHTIVRQLSELVEEAQEMEDNLKTQAALASSELDRLAAKLALEYHRKELDKLRTELAYYEAMSAPKQ